MQRYNFFYLLSSGKITKNEQGKKLSSICLTNMFFCCIFAEKNSK